MDPKPYSTLVAKRGFRYRYFFSPPSPGKPVLLLVHGFPSTSYDWHKFVAHFQPRGYGIIAPDLLGTGGTDRPLEVSAFGLTPMAEDLIEILDHHSFPKAIGVAHDWGCMLLSRLSVLQQARFDAFVWLGLSFREPPTIPFDLDAKNTALERLLGYRVYSYMEYFGDESSAPCIDQNIDSFIQLMYPKDPAFWRTYMCVKGKTAECIQQNLLLGKPSYLTEKEYETTRKNILDKGGIRSSLNWYIALLSNLEIAENAKIPEENYTIHVPVYFASALKDCVNAPQLGPPTFEKYGTQVTYEDFDCGHWIQLEVPEELNEKLERWLVGLSVV